MAFDWTTDLQDPVRRDVISKGGFESLLSNAGIKNEDHVVLYGDQNNWFAAYGFWLFKLYGHPKLSLMDGGRRRWELDRRELVFEAPAYPQSDYRVDGMNTAIRADWQFIVDRLGSSGLGLVDVRSPKEYTGEWIAPPGVERTAYRGGHIPDAINIPWSKATNPDGTYKSVEALRAIYEGAEGFGESPADIATYCFIGERAAHTWFALTHILGYSNVRNYDGSWIEWGNLVGVPIEQGPG